MGASLGKTYASRHKGEQLLCCPQVGHLNWVEIHDNRRGATGSVLRNERVQVLKSNYEWALECELQERSKNCKKTTYGNILSLPTTFCFSGREEQSEQNRLFLFADLDRRSSSSSSRSKRETRFGKLRSTRRMVHDLASRVLCVDESPSRLWKDYVNIVTLCACHSIDALRLAGRTYKKAN